MITLGVGDQWKLELGLEYKDKEIPDSSLGKISPEDLDSLYIIEETGNNLPTFGIRFASSENWKKYWNENSKLKISLSMGANGKKVVDTKMVILTKDVSDLGNGKFSYFAEGIYTGDKSAHVMCQTPYIQMVGPCIGTECLEECANKFFKKVSKEADSKGRMPWYQGNQSFKKFMDEVTRHSYIENSFLTIAITMNGEYRILDTVKVCSGSEQWTVGGKGANNIPIFAPPTLMSNSGFLNTYGGYGIELPIISMEYGVRTNYCVDIKLGLSDKETPNAGNVQRRTLAPVYFSGTNENQEYCKAPVNYDYGQALLSMEAIEIIAVASDFDIRVGDIIKVMDISSGNNRAYQDTSGKYMVGRVVRGVAAHLAQVKILATRNSGLQQ